MTRRFPLLALAFGLAVTGCSDLPDLESRVTDRAEAAEYPELRNIDGMLAEREIAQIDDETPRDLMAEGIGLAVRGNRMPTPNLIDAGRAQQARAEQAIIDAAIARQRLRDGGGSGDTAPSSAEDGPSAADELLRRVEELRARNGTGEDAGDAAARIEERRERLLDDARQGIRSDTVCPPNRPDCAAGRIRGEQPAD